MAASADFDLETFLPYLLNQAAEATSRSFHASYKSAYGMTRTQWRVLANLGKFGAMTARDICAISHIEKTKVSRAVCVIHPFSRTFVSWLVLNHVTHPAILPTFLSFITFSVRCFS